MMPIVAVLPLALTMNLGPQIVTCLALITADKPIRKSLYYLLAILIAATAVSMTAFLLFSLLKTKAPSGGKSTTSQILDYVFAGLLAGLGVYVFIRRKTHTKPKWLETIQEADGRRVFFLGLGLYSFFPTDLVASVAAARYLVEHKMHYYSVFPFLALTLLIAALPLLSFLVFKKRAEKAMPKVRAWLDTHAWIVNEVVIVFFICMILFT